MISDRDVCEELAQNCYHNSSLKTDHENSFGGACVTRDERGKIVYLSKCEVALRD